ncbi:serine/threonine-protein kinase [Streptomyces sp. NPDC048473]|uniref:serine/threonine-protein kinase n=1 Tax=unclassified Streptomyces TaxID=2593676 RepID=UPI003723B998
MSVPGVRRRLGRCELGELIGRGGTGQVWAGRDPELGRHVAIKLIHPREGSTRSDAGVARFRREAQIMARLAHSGIPQIYDIVTDPAGGGRLYIVMQRLFGSPLNDICRDFGRLPIPWVACLGAHLCSVLTYTGSVPLVHRDLKPANIMAADSGLAMVLDFGVSALLEGDHNPLTPEGFPVGTPRYMSPEQAREAEVTPRSDLYALGCILYELLTGRTPFSQDNAAGLLYHHVHEPPVPVRELRPEAGPELDRLVLDLLAKRPEDRPATAQEVFERLLPFFPRGAPVGRHRGCGRGAVRAQPSRTSGARVVRRAFGRQGGAGCGRGQSSGGGRPVRGGGIRSCAAAVPQVRGPARRPRGGERHGRAESPWSDRLLPDEAGRDGASAGSVRSRTEGGGRGLLAHRHVRPDHPSSVRSAAALGRPAGCRRRSTYWLPSTPTCSAPWGRNPRRRSAYARH